MYSQNFQQPRKEAVSIAPSKSWPVQVLSWVGVLLILSGMLGLALPTAQEGACLWVWDNGHALHAMDVAGMLIIGVGVVLTWLGGELWRRQV